MKNIIIKKISIIFIFLIMILILSGCNIISTNENSITTKPHTNNLVTEVKHEIKFEEDTMHYILLTAIDKENNTVWTYTTKKDYVAQYDNIEFLEEHNEIIYLNELGTITALDKQTGKVLWQNSEYNGMSSYFIFDNEGYLYLTSSIKPYLFVINPSGETIKKIETISANDFYWPSDITITDEHMLHIIFPSHTTEDAELNNELIMDIRDIKNTQNLVLEKETIAEFDHTQIVGFEDVKYFTLNQNGEVTITFEPYSNIFQNYTNGKTTISNNVKTIFPAFWGNGGYGTLIMIKDNGTVSVIDSFDIQMENLKVRELNIQNIDFAIQIMSLDGPAYGLVDNNGTIHIFSI